MREKPTDILEACRIKSGRFTSTPSDGNNGAFYIRGPKGAYLRIIASDGDGWDHVSVSLSNRVPNWDEMCFVKNLFWSEDETVVQYHPAKAEYVNNHPYCLHLWKSREETMPTPPSIMIGIKQLGTLNHES